MYFRHWLKNERAKQEISIRAFKAKSGLSDQTISRIERKIHTPNINTTIRAVETLGYNLAIYDPASGDVKVLSSDHEEKESEVFTRQ